MHGGGEGGSLRLRWCLLLFFRHGVEGVGCVCVKKNHVVGYHCGSTNYGMYSVRRHSNNCTGLFKAWGNDAINTRCILTPTHVHIYVCRGIRPAEASVVGWRNRVDTTTSVSPSVSQPLHCHINYLHIWLNCAFFPGFIYRYSLFY